MSDVEIKLEGLDHLIKALKGASVPKGRVGILGDQGQRAVSAEDPAEGPLTNAQVGAFHIFGTSRTPRRDFLFKPINEHLNKRLPGLFSKAELKAMVKAGTVRPLLEKACVAAEGIVAEAFDSNGFGEWAPLKESTLERKETKQTLVESQQLRNSITSDVTG